MYATNRRSYTIANGSLWMFTRRHDEFFDFPTMCARTAYRVSRSNQSWSHDSWPFNWCIFARALSFFQYQVTVICLCDILRLSDAQWIILWCKITRCFVIWIHKSWARLLVGTLKRKLKFHGMFKNVQPNSNRRVNISRFSFVQVVHEKIPCFIDKTESSICPGLNQYHIAVTFIP